MGEGNFRLHQRHYYLDMLEGAPSDESLVRVALAGDRDAFARLVERHLPVLLAVCRRVSNDPGLAEDAAQESVLRAMLSLDRLRDGARFGPWLVGIGLNRARQLARRQRRAELLAGALLGGIQVSCVSDDPALAVEQFELEAAIREAIATLPEGQQRAVQAFYFAGLSYKESAEALGTRTGSIKARLHKARKALRDRLGPTLKEAAAMARNGSEQVEVRVRDVRRRQKDAENDYHVLILEEVGGERHLPIWVGQSEGTAIAIHLQEVETPRPLTFSLMARLLNKSGAKVERVRIERLVGETFYATVDLRLGQDRTSVDARPSDAIALALVEGVPILVDAAVFVTSEANAEARATEDKWHGEGTLGAREIVADVTSRWVPALQERAGEE